MINNDTILYSMSSSILCYVSVCSPCLLSQPMALLVLMALYKALTVHAAHLFLHISESVINSVSTGCDGLLQ